jgi:hypothetical protein
LRFGRRCLQLKLTCLPILTVPRPPVLWAPDASSSFASTVGVNR